jgi:hypothetical protein
MENLRHLSRAVRQKARRLAGSHATVGQSSSIIAGRWSQPIISRHARPPHQCDTNTRRLYRHPIESVVVHARATPLRQLAENGVASGRPDTTDIGSEIGAILKQRRHSSVRNRHERLVLSRLDRANATYQVFGFRAVAFEADRISSDRSSRNQYGPYVLVSYQAASLTRVGLLGPRAGDDPRMILARV